MALEQSVDRLSDLIEQLIKQLELGRQGASQTGKSATIQTAPDTAGKTQGTTATASPSDAGKSSSGTTKSTEAAAAAPADTGASEKPAGLDYVKHVAPRFSLLVAKDRPAAIALMRKHKADAKKLEEAVLDADGKHDQGIMFAVLGEINELLGG